MSTVAAPRLLAAESLTPGPGLERTATGWLASRSPVTLSADAFKAIVQGGALVPNGMPQFEEFADDRLKDLRQFIRATAHAVKATN